MDTPFKDDGSSGDRAGARARASATGASDAPPSNRASERYKEEFTVLWQGIDFLELSFQGEISEVVVSELERLKGLAQSPNPMDQARAWFVVGQHQLQVKDRGAGLFKYVLEGACFLIKVRSEKAKAMPLAFVQIRSWYLAQVGALVAAKTAGQIVEGLGVVKGSPTVSRIDITVDFFSTQTMDAWDRSAWITRAEHRHSYSVGDRFSGYSIGLRGPIACRFYDKTLEIKTQSKKEYLYDLWAAQGWFPADQVWRIEFQLRRPALAQFGLCGLDQVLAAVSSLWGYLTDQWLRLAVVDSRDENRARWVTHPFWQRIQQIEWKGEHRTLDRVYRSTNSPSDKNLARAITSALTSLMAKHGLPEVEGAWRLMKDIFVEHWCEQETWEGRPYEDILRDKALIKERKYGIFLLSEALGLISLDPPSRKPG